MATDAYDPRAHRPEPADDELWTGPPSGHTVAEARRVRLVPGTPQHAAVCHALATVIADISEATYCAAWMNGIERTLWRDTRLGDGHYQGYTEGDHHATLKALGELIDGWVAWQDAPPYWRYVPRSEWEAAGGVRADELASRLPPRHDPALADLLADIKGDPDGA